MFDDVLDLSSGKIGGPLNNWDGCDMIVVTITQVHDDGTFAVAAADGKPDVDPGVSWALDITANGLDALSGTLENGAAVAAANAVMLGSGEAVQTNAWTQAVRIQV
jgi:hypothetical protein